MKLDLLKQMRSQDFETYHSDRIHIEPEVYEKLTKLVTELRAELEALFSLSPSMYDRKLGVMPLADWLSTTPEGRAAAAESNKISRVSGTDRVNEYIWAKYFEVYPHAKRTVGMPKGGGRVPTERFLLGWLISVSLKYGWSLDQLYDRITEERKDLLAA